MEMDGETGDENSEVEINASKTSQAKSDAEEMKFFHAGNYQRR